MSICPCGAEFAPRNTTQKYCLHDCKARPRHQRQREYVCEKCGQTYLSRLTGVKWPLCTRCREILRMGKIYEPTAGEIAESCRQVRARWTGTPCWSAPTEVGSRSAEPEKCPECRVPHRRIPIGGWPCLACRVKALVTANGGRPLTEEHDEG